MSLIRQIRLLLLGTLLLAFVGSVGVTIVSARDTLQTQLRLKNSDNATSLALVLSQQRGEPQLMELVMSAQFDSGFYRRIRLISTTGQALFSREADVPPAHAPAWFVRLVPIESTPGQAQVSDGWRALGSVQVVSHPGFAYDELWRGSLRSAAILAALGVLAALLASVVVKRIRRPLDRAVSQAQALVNGEFVIVPEPKVPELRRVTRAMNGMVSRLKTIFEAQAAQVEALRRQAHADPLTGLANRQQFIGELVATLRNEETENDGALLLLRLIDLARINRDLGHAATDRMIAAVAAELQSHAGEMAGCRLGRLNGSDFAVTLPAGHATLATAMALADRMQRVLADFGSSSGVAIGAVTVRADRPVPELMGSADAALARAESRGAFAVEVLDIDDLPGPVRDGQGEAVWRQQILDALEQERAVLVRYPVLDKAGQSLHLECPMRLQLEAGGPFETAARWLPLALRTRLTPLLDERAVRLALTATANDAQPRCINLSSASLLDSGFAARLRALALSMPVPARMLWLEVPETAAVDHFELVQELARQLRPLGIRFGLEHAGARLGQNKRLLEAGLDYVKLDTSIIHGVDSDPARATFLRGVVAMLHGLSLQVIAEGVGTAAEADAAWAAGVDGQTGPWPSAQRGDLVG